MFSAAKDTTVANLPLHDLAQSKIWCAVVALTAELTAWAQLLAERPPGAVLGTQRGD